MGTATLLLLLGVPVLFGVVLTVLGWRGRRVDAHPHCRGCGYDLTGHSSGASHCPECGRDVTRPGATVIGGRRRRPVALGVGLVCLIAAGGGGGVMVAEKASKAAAYSAAPSSFLCWVIHDPVAREELADRLGHGGVSAATAKKAIREALSVQGSRSRRWDASWGRLVEQAHRGGTLRRGQLKRYTKQAVRWQIKVRSRVQKGYAPDGYITRSPKERIGPSTEIRATLKLKSLRINGDPVKVPPELKQEAGKFEINEYQSRNSKRPLPLTEVGRKLGRATIDARFEVEHRLKLAGQSVTKPLKLTGQKATATVDVLDHPTGHYVDTIHKPSGTRPIGVWIDRTSVAGGSSLGKTQRMLAVGTTHHVHTPIEYWLRFDGEVHQLTQRYRGKKGSQLWSIQTLYDRFPALKERQRVDLIVRTDVEAVETATTRRGRAWLGQWTFEDVPLDAAAREPGNDTIYEFPTLVSPTQRPLTVAEATRAPRPRRAKTQ